MSGMQYLFDGEHRRKPQQNLGGRIETERTRDALLERAQNDRHRREKDRLVAYSIRKIQGVVRGFLVRARARKTYRSKYYEVEKGEISDSLEKHGYQIERLINFFDQKQQKDGLSYSHHATQLIQYKSQLMEKCFTDPAWSRRIRIFIRLGLLWFLEENGTKRKTQAQRSGVKLFQALSQDMTASEPSLTFFVKVWMDLLISTNFFRAWYRECENVYKHPTSLHGQGPDNIEDLLATLQLPLNLVRKLEGVQISFIIEKRLLTNRKYACGIPTLVSAQAISNRILQSFTKTFVIGNMIPIPTQEKSGLGDFFLSRLAPTFPWLPWASYLHKEFLGSVDNYSSDARHILYAVLIVYPSNALAGNKVPFMRLLCRLIDSVDNQFAPMISSVGMGYEEEQDMLSDMDDEQDPEMTLLHHFMNERNAVLSKLREYFMPLPVADWFCNDEAAKQVSTTVASCLIRTDPKRSSFPFLYDLAYKREYLRCLYEWIVEPRTKNLHEIICFTWLLNQLMNTLHDAEFITSLPLQRDELAKVIGDLVATYTSLLMHDFYELTDNMRNSTNQIISKCLLSLYDRNTRLYIFSDDVFLSHTIRSICPVYNHTITFEAFMEPSSRFSTSTEQILCQVLHEYPFAIPFHDRVAAWHRMIDLDKMERFTPYGTREIVQIRRTMLYEDTYDKLSPENVPDMRNPIRISLVNTVGMLEAGVDGGGLLREFLTEATKAGVDPNRGLFRLDTQNRIYPNPIAKKVVSEYWKHYFLIGRLVGKALYEQTLLELPLAAFFIQKCITGKVNLAVDYLATLDPALHKHLLGLKSFTGDFSALGLDFTVTQNELGETRTVNLKENGSTIMVDKSNVIAYIHLVADYKINKEVEEECYYFRRGLCSVVPILKYFSWREMQTLISGSDKPINIQDWKEHTNYSAGYTDDHRCIKMFWEVVEALPERQLRKLLKFVTSCSRPPLLGFKDLTPNFGIQSAGPVDRLPTAATCVNLLKLPEYDEIGTLREKLIYAIDAQAGFELS